MKTIGVLALQGAFIEHKHILSKLDCKVIEVRKKTHLNNLDGLILPGGESTTMGKLLIDFDLKDAITSKIKDGLPIWGTCAGLILLAETIDSDKTVHLGQMEITAVRNAYGRQLSSFQHNGVIKGIEDPYPMVFIRAPYISSCSNKVDVLSELDGKIVAARQDNMLVTSFHPELTKDTRMHEYFLKMN